MFRAIGRSALIAAAGLCLCISVPARAVENDAAPEAAQAESDAGAPVVLKKFTKRSKYSRRAQSRKFARAGKSSSSRANTRKDAAADAKKVQTEDAASPSKPDAGSAVANAAAATIPPSVANANAQWISSPQTAADLAASGMSAQANNALLSAQADATSSPTPARDTTESKDVVDSDQLNDVDRTLAETVSTPATKTTAAMTASQETRTESTPAPIASSDESKWNQTSLIGKIFIAFGGLLTLASAARMFIA